jgi:energy-coupling factor transport system permease protein
LLLVPLLSVIVFVVDKPPVAAGLALALVGLRLAAKMPFKKIRVYFKLLCVLAVFITLLQVLFGPGERYLLKPLIPSSVPFIGGRGSLKLDGLMLGFVIICRLLALMVLLPMLTLTTEPQKLALGLTRLGLNYRAAYIVTIALHLIPAFEEDARGIMDAQKLRAMRAFEEGGLAAKFKAYPALAVPLVLGAMRRAQLLGIALDARAFGAFKTRTWLMQIKMRPYDYRAFALCAVFSALALALNFLLK